MMQHLERESWALHSWWSSELERSWTLNCTQSRCTADFRNSSVWIVQQDTPFVSRIAFQLIQGVSYNLVSVWL